MSRLSPSTSCIPLVTIGMAVTPPVPVVVAVPTPSRLIQASSVNASVPRPGAGPSVTCALVPLKSMANLGTSSSVVVASSLGPGSDAAST